MLIQVLLKTEEIISPERILLGGVMPINITIGDIRVKQTH